jgi:hypothetical protein
MRLYFGLDGKTSFSRLETMKNQYILDTWYHPIPHKWHGEFKGIFLDSGAYSAWRQGKAIDREAYADYALSGDFDAVAGDLRIADANPDQTLADTEYLRGLGVPAIPAYHQGEPWEFLDHLIATYEYIGLGCTEDASTSDLVTDWLYKCFWRLCDDKGRPQVRVHGFRFVSRTRTFPFWSVDSTSWAQSEGSVSMTSIAKKMPWLLPLEISELVLKYYSRVPRCTRLTEPKQQELELTFDQQEEHHAR